MLKKITYMLKKDEIKWIVEAKTSLKHIKNALGEDHVLITLDYSRYFIIFSYASKETIATVLLQKNDAGQEQPISFSSQTLRDAKLQYSFMEKKILCFGEGFQIFSILCPTL